MRTPRCRRRRRRCLPPAENGVRQRWASKHMVGQFRVNIITQHAPLAEQSALPAIVAPFVERVCGNLDVR
jgi:hypothetical protein